MPSPFVHMKWGNAGHLTRALFNQREVWVTAKSEVRKISDMTPQHCFNTLLMIERMDDLPVESLHATPLYEALYDRVLSFLPREGTIKTETIANGAFTTEAWPYGTEEHPAAAWRRTRGASEHSAPPTTLARRIGVDTTTILSILESAIAGRSAASAIRPCAKIDYTDADGVETSRVVQPEKIVPRRVGFGFIENYLNAWDVEKEAPRVFKVERITRCEDW